MRLYADPTELASTSRLPPSVAEKANPLPRLEDRTGADLLLTILSAPLDSDKLLRKHCETGILVQLKRFGDLQSAITTEDRLFREILSMRGWSERSWLVVTGLLFEEDGEAVVGEIEEKRSMRNKMVKASVIGRRGLSFASLDAAIDAWRYYGGYAKFLPQGELGKWLTRQGKMLQRILEGRTRELRPRGPQRELRKPGRISWLAALFDGMGRKTARKVWEDRTKDWEELGWPGGPTLLDVMGYVTDYRAIAVPGISEKRIEKWRSHLGLEEDESGIYETVEIGHRIRETGEKVE